MFRRTDRLSVPRLRVLLVLQVLLVLPVLSSSCSEDSKDTHDAGDTDSDTDTDTDSDAGTDTDTDSDTDSDTDTDTDTDTESDTCEGVDAGVSDGCVRFVDIDVASSGDGLSWATAFQTVQEGIDAAYASVDPCGKCQVWIAEGIYYVYVTSSEDTIDLKTGMEIYGGFEGTEVSLDERDWEAHVTTLDGHEFPESINRVFHVVWSHGENVIDGFTITGGEAVSSEYWDKFGGGLFHSGGALELKNAIFIDNDAESSGGLISLSGDVVVADTWFCGNNGNVIRNGSLFLDNCHFDNDLIGVANIENGTISNCDFENGAFSVFSSQVDVSNVSVIVTESAVPGISVSDGSIVFLQNCYVEGCYRYEGGGLWSEDSTVHISDSVFVGNDASFGGAVNMDGGTVTNSIFYGNTAGMTTGGLLAYGDTVVTGCVFVNNSNSALGGHPTVSDSIFSLNDRGMEACNGTEVSRCLFGGSGIWAAQGGTLIEDSVMAGGGGVNCGHGLVEPYACGFGNSGVRIERTTLAGSVSLSPTEGCDSLRLHGSIIWDHYTMGADEVMYSLIGGGLPAGEGNINTDPLFVGYPLSTGTWSDVYWNEGLFQTELTDETASWTPGDLAGLFVGSGGAMVIADNTETVIWAWGNATSITAGDTYEILDLHLQPGSPAIDAGYGLGASAFDIEGNPRWDDPDAGNAYDCAPDAGPDCVEYVDMGAYERQP